MRRTICLALALPALAAAGCGDDEEGDGQAATTPATTAAPPGPTATTPSSGRMAVTIGATEFKFTPADVKSRPGRVTFRLRNDGSAPHALEIEGRGIEEETRVVQGGETADLRINLKPGRYEMYCPVGNHREMGMEGTLTVS